MAAERKERRKAKSTTNTISADDSARQRRSVSCVRTASLSSSSRISRVPGRSRPRVSRSRAFTRSATCTTLVPASLYAWKETAGSPSMRYRLVGRS